MSLNNLAKEVDETGKKIPSVRILGGEPCLNAKKTIRTIFVVASALKEIESKGLNHYPITRAVIQTKGVWFSRASSAETLNVSINLEEAARSIKGRIVFELSFKSPNDNFYLAPQVAGYRVLLDRVVRPVWESGVEKSRKSLRK